MKGKVSSVDNSTKENLENLAKIGEELLKKPVSKVNLETGNFGPSKHETNEQALTRCEIIYSSLACQLNPSYGFCHIITQNSFSLTRMQVCKAALSREAPS